MNGADWTKTVLQTEWSRRRARAHDLDEGQAVMKIVDQSCRTLPKNLICPLPVQDPKGSIDLLSRSPVHADARDGLGYSDSATARRGKTLA